MKTKTGIELIGQERRRQISGEGFSEKYDALQNPNGQLIDAAQCYLEASTVLWDVDDMDSTWPWDAKCWKPSDDPIRNLVKAGALIAAEIDRLQGLKKGNESGQVGK